MGQGEGGVKEERGEGYKRYKKVEDVSNLCCVVEWTPYHEPLEVFPKQHQFFFAFFFFTTFHPPPGSPPYPTMPHTDTPVQSIVPDVEEGAFTAAEISVRLSDTAVHCADEEAACHTAHRRVRGQMLPVPYPPPFLASAQSSSSYVSDTQDPPTALTQKDAGRKRKRSLEPTPRKGTPAFRRKSNGMLTQPPKQSGGGSVRSLRLSESLRVVERTLRKIEPRTRPQWNKRAKISVGDMFCIAVDPEAAERGELFWLGKARAVTTDGIDVSWREELLLNGRLSGVFKRSRMGGIIAPEATRSIIFSKVPVLKHADREIMNPHDYIESCEAAKKRIKKVKEPGSASTASPAVTSAKTKTPASAPKVDVKLEVKEESPASCCASKATSPKPSDDGLDELIAAALESVDHIEQEERVNGDLEDDEEFVSPEDTFAFEGLPSPDLFELDDDA